MTRSLPILAVLLLAAGNASAEKYSSGIYAEMGLGATGFLGGTGSYAAPGPAFGIRAGYDLFSWFSVGAIALTSTHEATVCSRRSSIHFTGFPVTIDPTTDST